MNLEDKNEIAAVYLKCVYCTKEMADCAWEGATGLALDRKTNRLFAGCDNKMLVVVDAESWKSKRIRYL